MQAWINGDDPKNVEALAKLLNSSITDKKGAQFMSFLVFTIDEPKTKDTEAQLTKLAETAALKDVCLTYLLKDDKAVKRYKFNVDAEVKNTVIVYKGKKVTTKFVNWKADEKGLAAMKEAINGITQ